MQTSTTSADEQQRSMPGCEGAIHSPQKKIVSAAITTPRRTFGAIIDVNSSPYRRPPIRSFADLQLSSPTAASAVAKLALLNENNSPPTMSNCNNNTSHPSGSCKKALSAKFASLLESATKSSKSPNKRKFNDENDREAVMLNVDTPPRVEDTCQHRTKRVHSTLKKKDTRAICKSGLTSPVTVTKCDELLDQSKTHSASKSNLQISQLPSTSTAVNECSSPNKQSAIKLYSKEQQLKWITEKDGHEDVGYYHVLIEQRFKALKEVWTENDQLERNIEELQQENEVLEPLFTKIIELKEMLFGDNDEQTDQNSPDGDEKA